MREQKLVHVIRDKIREELVKADGWNAEREQGGKEGKEGRR